MKNVVMTIIGEDRPGLVGLLAETVAGNGGNWLESRMSHLGGKFAGIVRIQVPTEQAAGMLAALKDLDADGLQVVAAVDENAESAPPRPPAETHIRRLAVKLELTGHDRPGIVRKVMQALAAKGVNIEDLHTECTSAPMSGDILFHADAQLHVPESLSLDDLRLDLERIASDLMVDLNLEPREES